MVRSSVELGRQRVDRTRLGSQIPYLVGKDPNQDFKMDLYALMEVATSNQTKLDPNIHATLDFSSDSFSSHGQDHLRSPVATHPYLNALTSAGISTTYGTSFGALTHPVS